jgi:hypothetical protein
MFGLFYLYKNYTAVQKLDRGVIRLPRDQRPGHPRMYNFIKNRELIKDAHCSIVTMHRKIFLDMRINIWYNSGMKNEIVTKMSPEGLEIANAYLELGSIPAVCVRTKCDENTVQEFLGKREVKAYIDQVYLDTGYRNRFKLADALDNIIEHKLEEAEESQIYTNKDMADLLMMAHKMRMDEIKAMAELEKAKTANVKNQTNVQINGEMPFGQGNYGKLMEKLLKK